MNKWTYLFLLAGAFVTIGLGATFGIVGLLTGIALMWLMKPLIEDMW